MKLTEHFRLGEFTRSVSAKAHDIDNSVPDVETAMRLAALCVCILEPLREHVGHPIRISSGYRCPELNAIVHGSATSQHMTGEACDIAAASEEEAEEYFQYIRRNLDFDQLIFERMLGQRQDICWIHVSYAGRRNRHEVMRANDGRTSYHEQKVATSKPRHEN